jgi:hypothetical protein
MIIQGAFFSVIIVVICLVKGVISTICYSPNKANHFISPPPAESGGGSLSITAGVEFLINWKNETEGTVTLSLEDYPDGPGESIIAGI